MRTDSSIAFLLVMKQTIWPELTKKETVFSKLFTLESVFGDENESIDFDFINNLHDA